MASMCVAERLQLGSSKCTPGGETQHPVLSKTFSGRQHLHFNFSGVSEIQVNQLDNAEASKTGSCLPDC